MVETDGETRLKEVLLGKSMELEISSFGITIHIIKYPQNIN